MNKLYRYCLRLLLKIPLVKGWAVYFSSRFDNTEAGVSDYLADLLPKASKAREAWAENHAPLHQSRVALVTVSGLFIKDREPFRESRFGGDFSYRLLPKDVMVSRLAAGRILSDHRLILVDPNIVFPIDRLKELKEEGFIGEVAQSHYSFLGYCSDPRPLAGGSAKEVARKIRYEGVDKVLIISGSLIGQETAVTVQHAIETEDIPTVSLLYSERAARDLRAPRACIFNKQSLCRLEEYLDADAQRSLLKKLLRQFDDATSSNKWVMID